MKAYLGPKALKEARQRLGLSQPALARLLEVATITIKQWEAEPRPPEIQVYYTHTKHRRINRAWAELIKRVVLEKATEQGHRLEPFRQLFSSVKSIT